MTRAEHLQWAKQRALEYLDRGDLTNAVASMTSDMGKHPELGINAYLALLGAMQINNGATAVRQWIEGFN